jgi:2-polyprenyl-3-methyl-5-hydroxy-6-metoxy-1,4-benzoquinol methylase
VLASAGRAAAVVGVDANLEAHEHARLRYGALNLRFARDMIETFDEPCDVLVFLQTIEHVQDPGLVLERVKALIGRGGVAYVSTPNVLTLAAEGAERSGNPWHIYEYRPAEFGALCSAHFGSVELFGLFHARKLALHERALKLGWDRVHARLGITKRFYDRFTPAIDTRDFALRRGSAAQLEGALDLLAVLRP